jgi:hypothetical protein
MKRIHPLMISLDKKLCDVTSPVFKRHLEYAKHFKHLSVIVLTSHATPIHQQNISVYPGIRFRLPTHIDVLTAQDPLLTGLLGVWFKWVYRIKLNLQIHTDLF